MNTDTIGGPVICQSCGEPYNCTRDIHICKTSPMSHPIPQDELQKVILFHNQRANKAEERIAALEAELREMTADRNLYRDEHDGEGHPLSEVVALRNELREAKQECEQAQQANELDRRSLHAIVKEIESEITGRMWLIESRGCYEWDDDKFRLEFGWAVKALREKLEPLRKIASDLSNSPKTEAGVNSVRKLEQECATLRATVERLKAPVSEEEAEECAAEFHDGFGIRGLTDFIAARAKEPK